MAYSRLDSGVRPSPSRPQWARHVLHVSPLAAWYPTGSQPRSPLTASGLADYIR